MYWSQLASGCVHYAMSRDNMMKHTKVPGRHFVNLLSEAVARGLTFQNTNQPTSTEVGTRPEGINRTLIWWVLRLLEFAFAVEHWSGGYHLAADAMSRLSKANFIAENEVEDDISTSDIQKKDKNDLPVVCSVIHVNVPTPRTAMLLVS